MKRVIKGSYMIDTSDDYLEISDSWAIRYRKTTDKGTLVFAVTMRDNRTPLAKLGIYSNANIKYPYKEEPTSLVEVKICNPNQRLDKAGDVIWKGDASSYTESVEESVLNSVASYMDKFYTFVEE